MVTEESTKDTVKTIAQGRPDDLAEPVVTPPAFLLQAGHGCGQHPAFPAPSSCREGRPMEQLGCNRAARTRRLILSEERRRRSFRCSSVPRFHGLVAPAGVI